MNILFINNFSNAEDNNQSNTFEFEEYKQVPDSQEISHHKVLNDLFWSPDGKYLALGYSTSVEIWNTDTWSLEKEFSNGSVCLEWSPNGLFLAVGSLGSVNIYETLNWKLINGIENGIPFGPIIPKNNCISWHPDSKNIAISYWNHTIEIIESENWNVVYVIDKNWGMSSPNMQCVSWSPDGNYFAYGNDNDIAILNVNSWVDEVTIKSPEHSSLDGLSWSHEMSYLLSYSNDVIRLYDVTDWSELPVALTPSDMVLDVKFSPDDAFLAVCTQDKTVTIWDTVTWNEIDVKSGFNDLIFSIAWSPNGDFLVIGVCTESAVVFKKENTSGNDESTLEENEQQDDDMQIFDVSLIFVVMILVLVMVSICLLFKSYRKRNRSSIDKKANHMNALTPNVPYYHHSVNPHGNRVVRQQSYQTMSTEYCYPKTVNGSVNTQTSSRIQPVAPPDDEIISPNLER